MAQDQSTAPAPPSTREERALELYRRGGIERIARDIYMVPSRSRRRVEYDGDLALERCQCRDHRRSGGLCLHIYAATVYRAHLQAAARAVAHALDAPDDL